MKDKRQLASVWKPEGIDLPLFSACIEHGYLQHAGAAVRGTLAAFTSDNMCK